MAVAKIDRQTTKFNSPPNFLGIGYSYLARNRKTIPSQDYLITIIIDIMNVWPTVVISLFPITPK